MILLTLSNLTQSSAQTGDTVKCYKNEELRKIALGLIKGKECQEELNLANDEIYILNQIIETQEGMLMNKDSIIFQKDLQITARDEKINELDKNIKKQKVKILALKVNYFITTVILISASSWFILK